MPAEEPETYVLHEAVSNREPIVYTRVIRFDGKSHLFHVRNCYEDGGIQMDGFYSAFDKRVKEEYQCDYRSNTKEGPYAEWHRNGRKPFEGRLTRGRPNGASTAWYVISIRRYFSFEACAIRRRTSSRPTPPGCA